MQLIIGVHVNNVQKLILVCHHGCIENQDLVLAYIHIVFKDLYMYILNV